MTQELRRLIDRDATQPVINERVASLLERQAADIARIGSDHEKRLRFVERTISYALGAIGLGGLVLTLLSEFFKK